MNSNLFTVLVATFSSLTCTHAEPLYFVGSCSDRKEKICIEDFFETGNKNEFERYRQVVKENCEVKNEVFSNRRCPSENKKMGCSTSGKMKEISWYYSDDELHLKGYRLGCKNIEGFKLIEVKK